MLRKLVVKEIIRSHWNDSERCCMMMMLELPVPNLGELSDLRTLGHVLRKERSPDALCYTYADLCDLDTVSVAVVPEKKGLILKHVEYEVTSQVDCVNN